MKGHSGATTSLWNVNQHMRSSPALQADVRAEICVVGAGIAGLSTAFALSQRHKVVVLDDGPVGGGETERTTAHLCSALDDRYFHLQALHGEETTRLLAESHSVAIDRIEFWIGRERIDCDFERLDGFLFAPSSKGGPELEREFEAAHRAGLTTVERVRRAPISTFDTGPCLRFPRQAQLHPLRYLAGLLEGLERNGGRLYSGTHVTAVHGGSPARVETSDGFVVTADAVVVATNTPINEWLGVHTKQTPHRTYVIAARVPAGTLARALYWDTCQGVDGDCQRGDAYHYVRLASDRAGGTGHDPFLLVGGEDHETGRADDAAERFDRLERWARERFTNLGPVEHWWSGQVLEPVDSVAFIGRDPTNEENVYIATGDSGNGMTSGTIAAMLIPDLIEGVKNRWESAYDPKRLSIRLLPEMARRNLAALAPIADWVTGGDVDSRAEVPLGEGAIIRRGLSKVAIYRDESGVVHELSPVCPHLGCIVRWNSAEKTWDCPCHGSRFDAHGTVLNGPANVNLQEFTAEEGTHDETSRSAQSVADLETEPR